MTGMRTAGAAYTDSLFNTDTHCYFDFVSTRRRHLLCPVISFRCQTMLGLVSRHCHPINASHKVLSYDRDDSRALHGWYLLLGLQQRESAHTHSRLAA